MTASNNKELALLDDLDNLRNLTRQSRLSLYKKALDQGEMGTDEFRDFTEGDAENICVVISLHPKLPTEVHSRDPGMIVLTPDGQSFKGEPRAMNESQYFDLRDGNRNTLMRWLGTWRETFPDVRREQLGLRLGQSDDTKTSDRLRNSLVKLTQDLRDTKRVSLGLER